MRKNIRLVVIGAFLLPFLGCGGAEDEELSVGAETGIEGLAEGAGEEAPGAELEAEELTEESGSESSEETTPEGENEGDESASVEEGEEADVPTDEEGGEEAALEGGEEPEDIAVVDGVPAPGSICPIPEPWGCKVGDNLKNMAFQNCAGEYITMYDAACGAAVSWVYFTYGW